MRQRSCEVGADDRNDRDAHGRNERKNETVLRKPLAAVIGEKPMLLAATIRFQSEVEILVRIALI